MGLEIHVEQMLNDLIEVAKQRRASIPYSNNEGMEQKIVIIGPLGEIETLNLTWESEREKYVKMKAVSEAAKSVLASAVILISDTRWTDSTKFGNYFHMPPMAEIGFEKWRKEYHAILGGVYGGLIKNLPREVWSEAVMVVIKGPRIKCESRIAPYIEGPNDSIQYIDSQEHIFDGIKEFRLLPDWWQ